MEQADNSSPEYQRFVLRWAVVIGCLAVVGVVGQLLLFRALSQLRAEQGQLRSERAEFAHRKVRFEELEDRCTKLTAEAVTANARLTRNRDELEKVSAQLKDTSDDVADTEARRDAMARQEVMLLMLRDEVYDLRKRREGLQAEIKRMTTDYAELHSKLRDVSSKLGGMGRMLQQNRNAGNGAATTPKE